MPLEASVFPFTRSEAQIDALRVVCRAWQSGTERFWAFDDVLAAVSRGGSLVYFMAASDASPWQGVILADVGPYSADLLYLYTAPEARRSGIGRRLVAVLLEELERRPQIEALFLEVRASNLAAQKLYEALGLSFVSKRSRYYADGEDALVFRRMLHAQGES